MEQNKEQKWYPVEYSGFWEIQSTDKYDAGTTNVLDAEVVGEEQARENAKLCASAPQMKELLEDMYLWMSEYIKTSGQHNRNGINYLINEYEKLKKQVYE